MENNRIDNCLNLINDIKVEFEQNCIENSKITTKIENTNDLQTRKIFWSLSSTERALQRCLDISEVEYRKPNPNYDPLKGQVSDEYMMERLRLYNEQKLRKQRLSNTDLVSNNNDNSNLYSSAFSSMMVNPNPDPISSPLPYSSSSSFRYPTLSQQPAASSSNYVETLSEMISKYRFGRTQHISSINSKFETNDINETESDPSLVGFRYNEYSFPQINDMSAFRNWIDVAKHQWKALLDKKGKLIPRSTYVSAVQSPTTVTYKTNTTKRSNTNTNAASSIGITYLESKDIIQGYESLSKALTHMHPSYVYLTFGGSRNPNDWPLYSTKNPCFTYQDTPFPGWHRDISVRQSGRDPGALDTLYRPPNTLRKLRNKGDIVQYLQTEHLPASLLSYFETRPVYCVCHQPQLEGRFYLGCSFGLGGCHGWLHPECVGLSDLTERELEAIEVICPLCAYFIDGITDSERHFKNRRVLREITYSPPTSYCSIAGKSILEDSEPLGQWGLLHSTVPSVGSPTQPHRNNFSAQTFQDSNIVSSDSVRISSSVSTGRIAREPPTRAGSSVTAIPRSQKIRSLNKDVPDDILRHSLFQMMPLDEDAEPQNESSNNNNNNSNSNNNSKINRAALVESSSDHTHMNANIISEPVIEPEPSVVEIPYIPLDVAYKRSLVESAIVFARPGNKKKRTRTGIDAVNEVEAAASKGSVIQLRMMVEEPALCFLPLESGSVCVGCVSEGDMLKSVHVPCAFSLLCGYCLMPFDSNKASDNRGLDNGKYDKKRKSSGIDEEYSFETAIQKVSWEVGVVSYEVHRSCAFYSRRAEMETVAQQDDEDADDIDDLEEKTSRNEITPQVGMNLGSDYIKLGRFHSYGEPDDAGCDLCGRTGGVVQYFTIDSSRSSLPPPRADGWLAHLPCINWLAKNRWLDMAATVSVDGADSSSEQSPLSSSSSSVQQQPQQQDYKSMFDCNFTAWRCILCSSQDGVTVRCCGVACTVRAHPLCIMHAGTPWQLVSGYIADASDSDKSHPKVSVPLFRCKVHSGLDSVCVS